VGVCIRGWSPGRLVFLRSKATSALISRAVLVLGVTMLIDGCVLHPNGHSHDLSNQNRMDMAEEGRRNLPAIAEATRSYHRQPSSASQPSQANGRENHASTYLFSRPSMQNVVLPQAHIVQPPESRKRRSLSPVVQYPDSSKPSRSTLYNRRALTPSGNALLLGLGWGLNAATVNRKA
jgi:hypothetical protein